MIILKRNLLLLTAVISLVASLGSAASAQKRSDRDIRDAIRSIDSKLEDFESNLRYQMQSTSAPADQLNAVTDDINRIRDSVHRFQDNYDRKRENRDDVNELVASARPVDAFLKANPQNRRVLDDWDAVKRQIDRLSVNYGVNNSWGDENEPQYPVDRQPAPVQKGRVVSVGLSGTYTLDTARSENIDDIVADTRLGGEQRDDLKDKLSAPGEISLDIRGDRVTLSSSSAPAVTFIADGREKTQQDSAGKTIRVRATVAGDTLTISSLGGDTDFTVKFVSQSDGRTLKVSRRITTDYMDQTVFAESTYTKTDSVARLGNGNGSGTVGGSVNPPPVDPNGGYSDNDQPSSVSNGGGSNSGVSSGGNVIYGSGRRSPSTVNVRPGNYIVPNGTIITGVLDNEINTRVSQNNDRFRLTVQTPDQFRGATIDGYVSGINRSGKISGQASVTFNFQKITLRNGQTYDFAGTPQDIRDLSGNTIKIDNEGTATGTSQTSQTVKRGGIGAGFGALIGAIVGGGKGAAIGAILGGGAGAGSVIVQGKDDIELMRGSTITVQASAPSQTYDR